MADRRRRLSMMKAMSLDESSGPAIFTGDEALQEVAKKDGGSGGVEEMRNVLGSGGDTVQQAEALPASSVAKVREVFAQSHADGALGSLLDRAEASWRRRCAEKQQLQEPSMGLAGTSSIGRVEPQLSGNPGMHALQRRKVKPYCVGDTCEVWSAKHNAWILDGDVIETVDKACVIGGTRLRAGSMKVLYMNRERCKWVPPQLVEEHLRRRSPLPPAPQPWAGTLLKEMHAEVIEWHAVHVEIRKGFIQWWEDKEAAARGDTSIGHAYLLAVQQVNCQGPCFSLRAVGRGGAVDTFQASTEEDAASWVDGLWEHAGYCVELEELRVGRTSSAGNLGGA